MSRTSCKVCEDRELAYLITAIESWTDTYTFNFQFWGKGNNNIHIDKDGIELYDMGGFETVKDCLKETLKYIERINEQNIINLLTNQ